MLLKLITSLSRSQKALIFLSIDLLMVPLALLFALLVQDLPEPGRALAQIVPVLSWLLGLVGVLGLGLGLLYAVGLAEAAGHDMQMRLL